MCSKVGKESSTIDKDFVAIYDVRLFGAYTFAGIWVLGFGSWVLQFGSWVLGPGSNKTRSIKIRLDIGKTHMPRPI